MPALWVLTYELFIKKPLIGLTLCAEKVSWSLYSSLFSLKGDILIEMKTLCILSGGIIYNLLLIIARGILPTSRFCTSWVTDTIRTLISLQRYMPSQTLFTFLGFKGKFSSHYLDPFQLSDEIKDGGESGYSCVRDLMAVSFNQRKAFFSPVIIWQEIWMVFLKLER